MVQQRLNIPSLLSRDKSNRRVRESRKLCSEIIHPLIRGYITGEQIPFINHEQTGLVILHHITHQLLVDFAYRLHRIKKHQHNICAAYTSLSPMQSVKFEIRPLTLPLPQARCVDCDDTLTVKFKHHIDTVTSGTWHLANNHSL